MKNWLHTCITSHEHCRIGFFSGWLPTRLVDVGLIDGSQVPRLIIASDLAEKDVAYVTLSHRWSDNVLKLKTSNIDEFRHGIPLSSLSKTFLDAILATRNLGVRYLWIDSLCILQDSEADWQAESVQMGCVYQNGLCNLAATASSDGHDGLFQQEDAIRSCDNKVKIPHAGFGNIFNVSVHFDNLWSLCVSESRLHRRGWVFQERILSPRTIHFGPEVFWECRTLQASETYALNLADTITTKYRDRPVRGSLPLSPKVWRDNCGNVDFWAGLIKMYGVCTMTKEDDRLIAMAGIAKCISQALGKTYLAGLWKEDLPFNLCWRINRATGTFRRSHHYRCKICLLKKQHRSYHR